MCQWWEYRLYTHSVCAPRLLRVPRPHWPHVKNIWMRDNSQNQQLDRWNTDIDFCSWNRQKLESESEREWKKIFKARIFERTLLFIYVERICAFRFYLCGKHIIWSRQNDSWTHTASQRLAKGKNWPATTTTIRRIAAVCMFHVAQHFSSQCRCHESMLLNGNFHANVVYGYERNHMANSSKSEQLIWYRINDWARERKRNLISPAVYCFSPHCWLGSTKSSTLCAHRFNKILNPWKKNNHWSIKAGNNSIICPRNSIFGAFKLWSNM